MSEEREVLNQQDIPQLDQTKQAAIDLAESETEEVYKNRLRRDSEVQFRQYIIELAGGLADTGLIETQFKKMLAVYKQQILGGWQVHTAMNTVVMQFENDKLLPLEKPDIYRLFDLYFKSIGFMPEVWVVGWDVSWSNIEL